MPKRKHFYSDETRKDEYPHTKCSQSHDYYPYLCLWCSTVRLFLLKLPLLVYVNLFPYKSKACESTRLSVKQLQRHSRPMSQFQNLTSEVILTPYEHI